jgi:hypothetical protein
MNPKTGKFILNILAVAAVPLCLYPPYEANDILSQIGNKTHEISFDSGTFYFLFASIFFTIKAVELLALRNKNGFAEKNAAAILLVNFVAVAILAPLFSQLMIWKLETAGYNQCEDPDSISRIARGESYIYRVEQCDR